MASWVRMDWFEKNVLFVGYWDGSIRRWCVQGDSTLGSDLFQGHQAVVVAGECHWVAKNVICTGDIDGQVYVWDLETSSNCLSINRKFGVCDITWNESGFVIHISISISR